MRSNLLQNIGCASFAALLSVTLAGCMTSPTKTASTSTKADEKCTEDCCKDDGKAVVVNKAKENSGQPATQPAATPAAK